jgi:hypothetical protein
VTTTAAGTIVVPVGEARSSQSLAKPSFAFGELLVLSAVVGIKALADGGGVGARNDGHWRRERRHFTRRTTFWRVDESIPVVDDRKRR